MPMLEFTAYMRHSLFIQSVNPVHILCGCFTKVMVAIVGRNIDSRVLSCAIDAKRAAESAVSMAQTKVIEEWVEAAINACSTDKIPRAELNEGEVNLLLAIYPDVDRIVEDLSFQLEYAWRQRFGHNSEMPWVLESHDVFQVGDRRGIYTRVKAASP